MTPRSAAHFHVSHFNLPMKHSVYIACLCMLLWTDIGLADVLVQKVHYSVIHPSLGKYKFIQAFDNEENSYQVKVYAVKGEMLQTLRVASSLSVALSNDLISFEDLDGDGFKDLLVNVGYGAGPLPSVSLYRYVKVSGKFEEDVDFPGFGIPTPAETPGCLYVEERISARDGYMFTEWCPSSGKRRWARVRSCGSATEPACYEKLSKYQFEWHRRKK